MTQEDFLNYRIISEKKISIVIFSGVFTNKFQNTQEECLTQLSKTGSKTVVLRFADITRLDKTTHRFLVRLQNLIRNELSANVRVCEIKPVLRTELLDIGIIKSAEYYENLKEALVGAKALK